MRQTIENHLNQVMSGQSNIDAFQQFGQLSGIFYNVV